MTVTLSPEQMTEGGDVDHQSEIVTTEPPKADVQELAALLAQAYVFMPLFP